MAVYRLKFEYTILFFLLQCPVKNIVEYMYAKNDTYD